MSRSLTVKSQLELIPTNPNKNILEYYGIPTGINNIVRSEKINLFNAFNLSSGIAATINELVQDECFFVEIPSGLNKLIKEGKAFFDKSSQGPGLFTPNIRIVGERGIQGQAAIFQKVDPVAMSNAVNNLAIMGMLQNIIDKVDLLGEKIDDILEGQRNDRIGIALGAFKNFMSHYTQSWSPKELKDKAYITLHYIEISLGQIHMDIDETYKALSKAPTNNLQVILDSLKHPSYNSAEKFQMKYFQLVNDLNNYVTFRLIGDFISKLEGFEDDKIIKGHFAFDQYCTEKLSSEFRTNMNFLTNTTSNELDLFMHNQPLLKSLTSIDSYDSLKIQCDRQDIKFLN